MEVLARCVLAAAAGDAAAGAAGRALSLLYAQRRRTAQQGQRAGQSQDPRRPRLDQPQIHRIVVKLRFLVLLYL